MSKREWGEGLVELTECYLKYCEGCIVQKGHTYQKSPQEIQHPMSPTGHMMVTYATDVDLLGVKLDTKEILLVECTEDVNTAAAKKLADKFVAHEEEFKWAINSGFRIRKYVSCVKLGYAVDRQLSNAKIEFLTTKEMTRKLLPKAFEKHKGEPILWILRTLHNDGMIQAPGE